MWYRGPQLLIFDAMENCHSVTQRNTFFESESNPAKKFLFVKKDALWPKAAQQAHCSARSAHTFYPVTGVDGISPRW